jgi:cytochrome c-type biogenesis protein CcmH
VIVAAWVAVFAGQIAAQSTTDPTGDAGTALPTTDATADADTARSAADVTADADTARPVTDPATGVGAAIPASAADVPPEDVAAIARDLNCPLCQGYNLQDCPLEVCAQMRALIRQSLAEGESRDEIIAAFAAEYGPQVLNAPPRRGFFLGAWILPIVALFVGVVAVGLFVRRSVSLTRLASESTDPSTPATDAAHERYARQLERMAEQEDE